MPVGSQAAWRPTCEDKVHRAPESLGSAVEIKQALSVVKQQHTFLQFVLKLSRPPIKYPPSSPQVLRPVFAQQENLTGQTYLPPNKNFLGVGSEQCSKPIH